MNAATDKTKGGIVCAGSWIVDLVHDIEHWPRERDLVRIDNQYTGIGGGAANVISDLRSLGVAIPLTPVGKLGTDRYGDIALEHCRHFDLSTEYMVRADDTPTAHTHVMNVPGGSRTFFYQPGTNDTFSADTEDFQTVVSATLPAIDYLFANEAEAARACGLKVPTDAKAWGEKQAIESASRLLEQGVKKAIIVHSPDGALYLGQDGTSVWSEPEQVPQAEIFSSVGAGDAFCAGTLYALHEGWDIDQALDLAHRVAGASLRGRTATDAIPKLSELNRE